MDIKCEISVLSSYRCFLIELCKKEKAAFDRLRKKCENAQWNDDVFMLTMRDINDVGDVIAENLFKLSECANALDSLIQVAQSYLMTANRFNIN